MPNGIICRVTVIRRVHIRGKYTRAVSYGTINSLFIDLRLIM